MVPTFVDINNGEEHKIRNVLNFPSIMYYYNLTILLAVIAKIQAWMTLLITIDGNITATSKMSTQQASHLVDRLTEQNVAYANLVNCQMARW